MLPDIPGYDLIHLSKQFLKDNCTDVCMHVREWGGQKIYYVLCADRYRLDSKFVSPAILLKNCRVGGFV